MPAPPDADERPDERPDERMAALGRAHRAAGARGLLEAAVRLFPGRLAVVSSFGPESAVLLDMVAEVDRGVPVLLVDTGKLFGETRRHRDVLRERLGLADVRTVSADAGDADREDPGGVLWMSDPARCCALRKVRPLAGALRGFDAWVTGRKRYQGGEREALEAVELVDGRVKLNPLADWSRADVERRRAERGLPPHPLEADGFPSVGCMPCTDRAAPGEGQRAGRWRGTGRTECGIHLPWGRSPR